MKDIHPGFSQRSLDLMYVNGLESLGSTLDVKFHFIAFVKTFVTVSDDCFEMDEYVFAVATGNETKTFGSIEPLDCSLFHGTNPFDVCCTDSFGEVYACFVCFITTRSRNHIFRHDCRFELCWRYYLLQDFIGAKACSQLEASPRGKKSITTVYC